MAYHIIERNENENAIITNSRLMDVRPISILIDDPNGPKPGYSRRTLSKGQYFYRYISQAEYEAIKEHAHITEEDIKGDVMKTIRLPLKNRWRPEDGCLRFYFTEHFFATKRDAKNKLKLPETPDYRMQFTLLENVSFAYRGLLKSDNPQQNENITEIYEIYIESNNYPNGINTSVRSRVSFAKLI